MAALIWIAHAKRRFIGDKNVAACVVEIASWFFFDVGVVVSDGTHWRRKSASRLPMTVAFAGRIRIWITVGFLRRLEESQRTDA